MSLKHIKLKILSVKKTAKVTRAMEAVSAVKMRKAQERAFAGRGYALTAMRILKQVSGALNVSESSLVKTNDSKRIGIVIITSDKGLAGALNASVLKAVTRLIQTESVSGRNVVACCIGKRGFEYAQRRGFDIIYSDTNVSDEFTRQQLSEVTEKVVELQSSGKTRTVYLVYTNFKSTFEQQAVTRAMLPLSVPMLQEMVDGILPAKGKYAMKAISEAKSTSSDYRIEPGPEAVTNEILPLLANIAVFHALSESKASEHSARMVAMKNATDKAKEVAHELTLEFNKKRQAAITAEVSEITSGMEAMK
jgi:F-type H+-transporting ATPase subunit gamma